MTWADLPATAGNPAFANRAKDCADAELVARTRKAGAVVWGKTNVPFMLGDFQSYNAIYGTTNNPYDVTRTPGGSSGGAAAALATGITPLEIGSDIGGSLRHPANFCGVCSLKPTWGVLPMRGHVPPPPGFDAELDLGVGGPMARNVGDLKLLWDVLLQRKPSELRPGQSAAASRCGMRKKAGRSTQAVKARLRRGGRSAGQVPGSASNGQAAVSTWPDDGDLSRSPDADHRRRAFPIRCSRRWRPRARPILRPCAKAATQTGRRAIACGSRRRRPRSAPPSTGAQRRRTGSTRSSPKAGMRS